MSQRFHKKFFISLSSILLVTASGTHTANQYALPSSQAITEGTVILNYLGHPKIKRAAEFQESNQRASRNNQSHTIMPPDISKALGIYNAYAYQLIRALENYSSEKGIDDSDLQKMKAILDSLIFSTSWFDNILTNDQIRTQVDQKVEKLKILLQKLKKQQKSLFQREGPADKFNNVLVKVCQDAIRIVTQFIKNHSTPESMLTIQKAYADETNRAGEVKKAERIAKKVEGLTDVLDQEEQILQTSPRRVKMNAIKKLKTTDISGMEEAYNYLSKLKNEIGEQSLSVDERQHLNALQQKKKRGDIFNNDISRKIEQVKNQQSKTLWWQAGSSPSAGYTKPTE